MHAVAIMPRFVLQINGTTNPILWASWPKLVQPADADDWVRPALTLFRIWVCVAPRSIVFCEAGE